MKKATVLSLLVCVLAFGSAGAQTRGNNVRTTDAETPKAESPCGGITAGNITFSSGSYSISTDLQSSLNTLAGQMQYAPACRMVILGSGGGSKVEQQLSWDRVNAVIEYMSEQKNIDRNRFVFVYGSNEATANTVLFRNTRQGEEDAPSSVPAPHPDLRR